MLIDTRPSGFFNFFFRMVLRFNGIVVDFYGYGLLCYVFKPTLTNHPYSKMFSLELLPVEYLELSRVVGWNLLAKRLTAKSCLLR